MSRGAACKIEDSPIFKEMVRLISNYKQDLLFIQDFEENRQKRLKKI